MRVIQLHLLEMDVLACHLVRNGDCGIEGCMVGMILPGEGGKVDVNYWIGQKRRQERLVSKFKQFGDARINLFAAIQFLALVEKVVQLVDVSSGAKSLLA